MTLPDYQTFGPVPITINVNGNPNKQLLPRSMSSQLCCFGRLTSDISLAAIIALAVYSKLGYAFMLSTGIAGTLLKTIEFTQYISSQLNKPWDIPDYLTRICNNLGNALSASEALAVSLLFLHFSEVKKDLKATFHAYHEALFPHHKSASREQRTQAWRLRIYIALSAMLCGFTYVFAALAPATGLFATFGYNDFTKTLGSTAGLSRGAAYFLQSCKHPLEAGKALAKVDTDFAPEDYQHADVKRERWMAVLNAFLRAMMYTFRVRVFGEILSVATKGHFGWDKDSQMAWVLFGFAFFSSTLMNFLCISLPNYYAKIRAHRDARLSGIEIVHNPQVAEAAWSISGVIAKLCAEGAWLGKSLAMGSFTITALTIDQHSPFAWFSIMLAVSGLAAYAYMPMRKILYNRDKASLAYLFAPAQTAFSHAADACCPVINNGEQRTHLLHSNHDGEPVNPTTDGSGKSVELTASQIPM